MGIKGWIIVVFLALTAVRFLLQLIQYRSAKNPIPENVKDVYDNETYLKWQEYHGELSRLGFIEELVSAALMVALLLSNAHVAVSGLLGQNGSNPFIAVILFQALVEVLFALPFRYVSVMKIEEKYGFNRSTVKTFVKDQIIGFIMGFGLNCFFVLAIYACHDLLGDGMAILLSVILCLFLLIANLVSPLFRRIHNKFTPLPEGSLRDKLTALLSRHGYRVKAIEVMDASRRTSKSNAYFSGLGKQKRIVLFDTLLEAMDEDEICAVFAHELGHGLHHDIPRLLFMSCVNIVFISLFSWLVVREPSICQAFGFEDVNYGFAFLILGLIALPLFAQIWGLLSNAISRRAEYAADAQAVKEGYGEALVSGLKKLSRENFAHLSPSKVLVVLGYSHPPLSQRIEAIEAAQK